MNATITSDLPTRPPNKLRVRKAMADAIKMRIRVRVGMNGMGADKKLAGYSENPLVLERGAKRRLEPSRGWGSFHKKGYKQYREEVGLVSGLFGFDNKGGAWRDWMEATQPATGPMQFGFANSLNFMAAEAAIDGAAKGPRPDMFDLNVAELEDIGIEYLEGVLDDVWGNKTP